MYQIERNEDKKSWIFPFPYSNSSESKICIFWLKLEGQTAVDSGSSVIAEHLGKILYTDSQKMLFSRYCRNINKGITFFMGFFLILNKGYQKILSDGIPKNFLVQ